MPIDHFKAQQLGRLEFLARQAVEGFITGLHKSPYHGFSVEFAEHRAYNTGESVRHVDWKLYGRTDKMFVKRYEEETNLRCHLVIDRSGSMFYPKTAEGAEPNKIRFSLQAAASLIYLMRGQRDAVGMSFVGDGVELTTPAKSSSVHHRHLFDLLEKEYVQMEGATKTDLVNSLHTLAEQIHKRSLIILFSDMVDSLLLNDDKQQGLFEALQHLRYNKHEVVVFHVMDKRTEVEFDFEERPHTFVDTETGERIKLQPNEVRDAYKKTRLERISAVKLKCRQFKIDWIETDIEEGVQRVLERFLAKRSRMV